MNTTPKDRSRSPILCEELGVSFFKILSPGLEIPLKGYQRFEYKKVHNASGNVFTDHVYTISRAHARVLIKSWNRSGWSYRLYPEPIEVPVAKEKEHVTNQQKEELDQFIEQVSDVAKGLRAVYTMAESYPHLWPMLYSLIKQLHPVAKDWLLMLAVAKIIAHRKSLDQLK